VAGSLVAHTVSYVILFSVSNNPNKMSARAAVMSVPPTAWFQQASQSKAETDKIIEMNRKAVDINASQQKSSYADQSRAEKLSFGMRDSLERNTSLVTGAIERNNTEDRVTTLKIKAEEARQESANFTNVLLASKTNRAEQASQVNTQKYVDTKTALDFELDVLDSEGSKGRWAIRQAQLTQAQYALDLKSHVTDNNSETLGNIESGLTRMELAYTSAQHGAEKDNTLLAIQTERTQADTNRRLVLDRARNDDRVQAVTEAATLQEAENRTKVLLYEIQNSAATARGDYEAKQLLRTTTAKTEQAVAASGAATTRDALLLARAEAAMYRSRPRPRQD
jgi:hypothetical protein